VVPGAPLEGGRGWRIWYSHAGIDDFVPASVRILRGGAHEQSSQQWRLLNALPGLDRRVGILTVELANPVPGAEYHVAIPELAGGAPLLWRSLHDSVDSGVTFLFASCFWRDNDKEGAYSAAIRQLQKLWSPAFKMLIGDQVYQDWPPEPIGSKTSLELYAARYTKYWGDPAYQEVLRSSPNFFLCDDHEFWNDYPEKQVHLARTWAACRQEHARAATELYNLFQVAANPQPGLWYRFQIGPVSFFIADTRSQRDRWEQRPHHFFQEPQWADLERWVWELRGPGVLVLGQPLFQRDGDWKDHSLSNFEEDYGRLCALIERSLQGDNHHGQPHDILMLSGDIHVGRYCVGTIAGVDGSQVHEFVVSPASRVGPYICEPSPDSPPTKFVAKNVQGQHPGTTRVWHVERAEFAPTIHNNVGMVRMTAGTNGRVRFELMIWRVRPHDSRSFWERTLRQRQPDGPVVPLFRKEIQLR
jgi:hypothetical protein